MEIPKKAVITLFAVHIALVAAAAGQDRLDLSGPGWNLWLDHEAPFEKDELHLPPVDLEKVLSRPPSCGWEELYGKTALPVHVPGTVEEYLWGEIGDYRGVSWWWREFSLSRTGRNQAVTLRFEAARVRCEVYLNEKLVGYHLIENTPFDVDVT